MVGVIEVGSRIVEGGETEGSIDSLHTECFSTLGLEHDERAVFVRVGSKVWSQPAIAAWLMPYPLSLPRLQNTHRRMILVAFGHANGAIHESRCPVGRGINELTNGRVDKLMAGVCAFPFECK